MNSKIAELKIQFDAEAFELPISAKKAQLPSL